MERIYNIINEEYYKMTSLECFKELVGEDGVEELKDYVRSYTSESLLKCYTETDYIKEGLKNMVMSALGEDMLVEAKNCMEVLYSIFKNY